MENETLETVPEEWSDITIDSQDSSISFGDGSVYSIDNPLPVQIVEPSVDESLSSEEESIFPEDAEAGPEVRLFAVNANSDGVRAVSSQAVRNVWKVRYNNEEHDVLFPENATLSVIDGQLFNLGSSNITGVVIDNSFSDTSYSRYTLTVMPVTGSNSQTSVYRYGSRCYLTYYEPGTINNLQTTVSYIPVSVVSRPYGWRLTPADWLICGLLFFSILVSILGGLIRR